MSGFKQMAVQREALVAIKQAAILKKSDVLLVFMFGHLGRRDDETPFAVECFIKDGIAVWNVMEGGNDLRTVSGGNGANPKGDL